MTTRTKFSHKLLSIILCIALLVAYIPAAIFTTSAAEVPTNKVADPSTMDTWKNFFLPENGDLSTENAGGVWTNKSVFTDASAFPGITLDSPNSFLVALSAIASNMTVTGMSSVPTDTMLVLDVSGSMNDNQNNNDVAEELVEAANASTHTLLTANKHNRVGIILYSSGSNGSAAVVLLPLGRYTTGTDNQYVNYTVTGNRNTTETVSLDPDTVLEGTTTAPQYASKNVVGGTFIQNGLHTAKNQFVATGNQTTITDPTLGTIKRKPVLVLMSDGAPTYGSSDFMNPTSSNMGTGSSSTAGLGFVTQLTASYVKNRIEEKYGNDCLFYTLGLGTGNDTVATSVLNPSSSSSAINTFWTQYNTADVDDPIQVQSRDRDNNLERQYVIKTAEVLDKNYVDKHFNSASYTGTSLAEAMKQAFADIVGDIQLQSAYFPTLISGSEDLSGYISFVDKIGQYMNVTDIKGLNIGSQWFSGAELSKNFVPGGGLLGTFDNSTTLGDELVIAVRTRLGLESSDAARTLIGLAYEYGQLSYTDENNYSNYIGWYANAAGQFLGFWHEGITTMPDPSDPNLTDATRPYYIMKSYGYLGTTGHGLTQSDMLYATVQVRQEIVSGEQSVLFAVPAALIPVVTYEVSLDQTGKLSELAATGATAPIRLVYEVALDSRINAFNVKDVVSADYLAANTNPDGSINFYTNQYEVDNSTGYGKVNTYSYFRPSRQNDRYYYQENALIYTDTAGNPYTGTAQPTGTMYHAYTVYKKEGSAYNAELVYHTITAEALETAERNAADNTWYLPMGDVRRDYSGYSVPKAPNATGTLPFSSAPFTDIYGHSVNDLNHGFVFGATLGNNGKLTLQAETGIKLSKAMADGSASDTPFQFTLVNTSNSSDNSLYPAYLVSTTGEETTSVQFTNGTAQVSLLAGQTLYIGGMTAGDVIRIAEEETASFKIQSITVNGVAAGSEANVTVEANILADVSFVNAVRGQGSLTITKEIHHPFGTEYEIPDKAFQMTVTLTGIGTANATFPATHTGDASITEITTNANGVFTVTLKHTEQISITGLPEGTVATVIEQNPGNGFTPEYWDNNLLGDGVVTVQSDVVASVVVANLYVPQEVFPVNITVAGIKTLTGRDWADDDVFQFQLQKWMADTASWQILDTQQVLGTDTDQIFDFIDAFESERYTTADTYYYRIVEIEPETGALGGITYDKTVHSFAVDVGDPDMDGALQITAVRTSRPNTLITPTATGWHVDASFTNTYSATGSTTVTIDINKTVENPSGSTHAILSGFTFGLYELNGTLVATSQPTTDRGFTRLVLDNLPVGTHHLVLKEITPNPIPAGWTYSQEEIPVTVIISDDGDGHLSAVIYKTADGAQGAGTAIQTTFVNQYVPTSAELTVDFVNKELQNKTMAGGEFTFAIYQYDHTTDTSTFVTEGTNGANGKVTFADKLTFDQVGLYFFDIKETSTDGNGITTDKSIYRIAVTVTDTNGVLTATYEVLNVLGNQITFVNTYTAQPVSYNVHGTKSLTGRVLLNDEFTFILTEALDATGTTAEDAKTYEAKNLTDGTFAFPAITYTAAGTYYYVVSEQEATGSTFGIIYDTTEYVVTVNVLDNGTGNLVIGTVTYTVLGNGAASSIVFNNTYVAAPTNAQIPGTKVLTGKVLGEGDFAFELYAANADWTQGDPLETVSNAADGSFSFSAITYNKVGTYRYLVKEVHGGETIDGVIYDDSIFRVQIEVTDDLRGNLHAEIVVFNHEGIPQEEIQFLNVYEITGGSNVTLNGEKTLTGMTLTDGMFTFELFATDASFEITDDALQTVTNTGSQFSFSLDYTAEQVGNTYYYAVREMNGGQTINGITYSPTVYHITVQVLDNEIGGVKTVTTITDGSAAASTLSFTNIYHAEDVSISLNGHKTLDGRDLEAGEFAFLLHNANASFEIDPEDAPIKVYNKLDGTFAFENLTFTEVGTYYFVITEDDTVDAPRVTFDETIYHVTVHVTDPGNGQLVAEAEIVKSGESGTAEEIRFNNVFTPKPDDTSVTIFVEKTVQSANDETYSPEGFQFLLEKIGGGSQTVKTDANGKAHFTLSFTEADIGKTYSYKLTEINDGRAYIKYSKAQYNISISVSLSEANQLVATVTVNDIAAQPAVCQFVNEYDFIPKTGETVNLSLWLALLFVSGTGLTITSVAGLKKKETI